MGRCIKLVSVFCALCILCTSLPMRIFADENVGEPKKIVSFETPQKPNQGIWRDSKLALNTNFILNMKTDGDVEPSTISSRKLSDCFYMGQFEGEIEKENDIIDVAVPYNGSFIAGLKSNGTVYVTGPLDKNCGQNETTEWADIAQITASDYHVAGLNKDGTVVSTVPSGSYNKGQNNVEGWTDIVKIDSSKNYTIGLKSDGTVVTTSDDTNIAEVKDWTDIVNIEASENFVIGIKNDGSVVYTASDFLYSTKNWKNIVDVSAWSLSSKGYAVAADIDGNVFITTDGSPLADAADTVSKELKEWKNIVKVYAGNDFVIGVDIDGNIKYSSISSTRLPYLKNLSDFTPNIIKSPDFSYNYEDLGEGMKPYGYLNFYDDSKDTDWEYKIYYTDDIYQNPYNSQSPDENLYSDVNPIEIVGGKAYNVVVTKNKANDTSYAYPTKIFRVNAVEKTDSEGGFLPEIKAVRSEGGEVVTPYEYFESGVVNPLLGSITFKFKAFYNGEELDCFDIYWKNANKINDEFISSNDEEKTFTDDTDVTLQAYAKLKNSPIQTGTVTFDYIFLKTGAVKYPISEYDNLYNSEEIGKLEQNIMIPNRNIIKVVSGSNLTLGLTTNGTVESSYNENNTFIKSKLQKIVQGNSNFKNNISNASYTQAKLQTSKFTDDDWKCIGNWRMISDIAVGAEHAVGLRIDGTVVVTGSNDKGQCETSLWKDIVAVAAGYEYTIGLKNDGTVVATGEMQEKLSAWNPSEGEAAENKIIKVAANNVQSAGLRADGTVLVQDDTNFGISSASSWTNIVDIAMGTMVLAGLKNDGTVVVVGNNEDYLTSQISEWKNIVKIAVGTDYVLALDYNGKLYHAEDSSIKDDLDRNKGCLYISDGTKVEPLIENTAFLSSNGSISDKTVDIFEELDKYELEHIAAGTCQFVAVTKSGRPITVIHNTAFEASSDKKFPILAAQSLNNGPTFINSCPPARYNHDLKIDINDTTSGYSYRYTTGYATNPSTDAGIQYVGSIDFKDNEVLTVLTQKNDGNGMVDFGFIIYYYNFKNPDITSIPEAGVQTGPVDVKLKSSISSYNIYYTTDGTEPPASITSTTDMNIVKKYDGLIHLDESTYVRARAYTSDGASSSEVFDMYYSIPTEPIEGNVDTIVDYKAIGNNVTKIWTAKNSPYVLNESLNVHSGGKLQIEPGVVVKLAKNVSVTVNGTLIAEGEEGKTIRFIPNSTDKWSNITLNPSNAEKDSVTFCNVEVSGAVTGVKVLKDKSLFNKDFTGLNINNNTSGFSLDIEAAKNFKIDNSVFTANDTALLLKSTANNIDNCTFDKNGTAIFIGKNDNIVTNSIIKNSRTIGIENKDAQGTKVNQCTISANLTSVKATSTAEADYKLDFTNNIWGNVTEGIIRNRIIDKMTNPLYPEVDITGFKSENPDFSGKCEFDTVLYTGKTTTALTIGNAKNAKTIYLTAAKLDKEFTDAMTFFVAMYDENDTLVKIGISSQPLPDTSSTTVTLTMCDADNVDFETVSKIKVFVMSADGKVTPLTKSYVIE